MSLTCHINLEVFLVYLDSTFLFHCFRMSEKVFNIFLERVSLQERDEKREQLLVLHAQFLLTHFNHTQPQIRRLADKLLSKLVDK